MSSSISVDTRGVVAGAAAPALFLGTAAVLGSKVSRAGGEKLPPKFWAFQLGMIVLAAGVGAAFSGALNTVVPVTADTPRMVRRGLEGAVTGAVVGTALMAMATPAGKAQLAKMLNTGPTMTAVAGIGITALGVAWFGGLVGAAESLID